MKILIITFISLVFILSGCYKMNSGSSGDASTNVTGGFWRLSEYSIKGKSLPISINEPLAFIEAKSAIVRPEDKLDSSLFRNNYRYSIFIYSQTPMQKSDTINAYMWDVSQSKSKTRETSWFKIDNKTGFRVIMEVDPSVGLTSKLQISNIMKSSDYVAELDTIQYTYVPTSNWH